MTWTYDPADLATTDLYQVRFLVGDTLSADPLLTDEEIEFLLASLGSVLLAGAEAARNLAARFSREADQRVGDLSESSSQRAKAFLALSDRLANQTTNLGTIIPVATGTSVSDKQASELDTDRVRPYFTRELFDDYPGLPGGKPRTLGGG